MKKENNTKEKTIILTAAMALIGASTIGLQNGLHPEDIAEFVGGIILLAVWHYWIDHQTQVSHKFITDDIKTLADEVQQNQTMLNKNQTMLNNICNKLKIKEK